MSSISDKVHQEIWELGCQIAELTVRNQCDLTQIQTNFTSSKLLILLDMNGTLLYRSKTALDSKYVHFSNGSYYFHRPGVRKLLKFLLSHRHWIDIAFYTSMTTKNATFGAHHLLKDMDQLYIYDQTMNKKDPEGEHDWSMMRDLPLIWNTINSPGFGHDERSTIMIDDSWSKMREYPENVIVIPEFNESDVLHQKDDVINKLHTALSKILDEATILRHRADFDIREILKAHNAELKFEKASVN